MSPSENQMTGQRKNDDQHLTDCRVEVSRLNVNVQATDSLEASKVAGRLKRIADDGSQPLQRNTSIKRRLAHCLEASEGQRGEADVDDDEDFHSVKPELRTSPRKRPRVVEPLRQSADRRWTSPRKNVKEFR